MPVIDDSNPLGDRYEALTTNHPSLRNDLIAFARRVGLAFYKSWLGDAEVEAEGKTLKFSGIRAFASDLDKKCGNDWGCRNKAQQKAWMCKALVSLPK